MENRFNIDGIENSYYLFGILNEFENTIQTKGNALFKDISWKQFFLLITIKLFENPPTINELALANGCSHQNTKKILQKLEKQGYVKIIKDTLDGRKQRALILDKANELQKNYSDITASMMKTLFGGVDSEDLAATVRTIKILDTNLKEKI